MTVGLNSRPKEWSRRPEPPPPDAGCWCSRNKRRPYVSLIWCSTPSGHGNGLRPWIRTNGWRTDHRTCPCERPFRLAVGTALHAPQPTFEPISQRLRCIVELDVWTDVVSEAWENFARPN